MAGGPPAPRAGRLTATLVLALVLGPSLYDIARGGEHWPYSSYPMYADVRRDATVSVAVLYGVTESGAEVPLRDVAFIAPFDQSRIAFALESFDASSDRAPMAAALHDLLVRYEDRRAEHGGPPLRAMRAYRVVWSGDPRAADVERPARRELLGESR